MEMEGNSMKRKIINIDQEKCNGCGQCVSDCPEGALQLIDGKARLVGDLLCDGLGACLQACPENAISIEEREAEPYNEIKATMTFSSKSHLTHWPIQLHLISSAAAHYKGSDLLVAADCVAYTLGNFHELLKGHTLVIACPKLDSNQETYLEKLTALIDQAELKSIQVAIMQVPCCRGLLKLVMEAANRAQRKPPITCTVVGLQGEILQEK